MADFSTEKVVAQRNHAQSKKASAHSFGISKNLRNLVTDAFFFSGLALSVIAARCQIPPFVAARHLPPAGGSRPSKWEPLAVHAKFISLPRPLPLGEVSPQVTERARLLTVCSNLPHIRYQRSRSRPLPSCRQTARSPWWRGGRHPRRTPPSSSGS